MAQQYENPNIGCQRLKHMHRARLTSAGRLGLLQTQLRTYGNGILRGTACPRIKLRPQTTLPTSNRQRWEQPSHLIVPRLVGHCAARTNTYHAHGATQGEAQLAYSGEREVLLDSKRRRSSLHPWQPIIVCQGRGMTPN